MSAAFDADVLSADLKSTRQLLADFFAEIDDAGWNRHTDGQGQGWTIRQTCAHLVSVATFLQQIVNGALAGELVAFPELQRTDLPSWNEDGIGQLDNKSPQELVASLLTLLQDAADQAALLSSDELAQEGQVPFYNRPMSVAELLGSQAIHPGLIHAAQLANGAGTNPLWINYPPPLMQRQLTRMFHLFSRGYWPERGGDLRASMNFIVGGSGGGRWYLTVDPNGGSVGVGRVNHPSVTVWFRNANALCRALTLQLSPLRAILTGQSLAWGKISLVFRLEQLFLPT